MNHKLAIAAILAGALGGTAMTDKSLNDNQKIVAGVTTVIALAYAAYHHEEVLDVFNTLTRAATVQSDFKARINNLTKQITEVQVQIDSEKERAQ